MYSAAQADGGMLHVELWGQRARKDAQDPGEVIAAGGWGGGHLCALQCCPELTTLGPSF